MLGKTIITRKIQTKEAQPITVSKRVTQNNPQGQTSSYSSNRRNNQENNYSVINKPKESNKPYQITIKTIYERGKKGQQEKYESKTDNTNKTHYHKLTAEERKKFSRGIRPSAAQREMDKYNQMDKKQRDEMIEIIDKTDKTSYPTGNQNIKLKQNNKTTLINRNKVANDTNINDNRRKYARGLRQKEPEKEREEIEVKEVKIKENEPKKPIVIKDLTNNRRNNNRPNQDIQLIPNKKIIIRNPNPKSPNPSSNRLNNLPQNYDPKRNLTKKVEKTTSRLGEPDNKKGGFRNNTVSHAIIDIKRAERKPYVLNERKIDIIKFSPNNYLRYNTSKEKPEPYKGSNNHSIIITKNVTKEYKTVADIPDKKAHHRYNYSHDPNLKNTSSHKIDATKKEPKKEIVVQPRKLIVIKSVIPSRRRNITEENNDSSNKKQNQNLLTRKYETDKKVPTSLAKKIANVREYKDNLQNKQKDNQIKNDKNIPEYRINRRSNNEPQKPTTNSYTSKYAKPIITKPQTTTQKVPTTQYTRVRPDYSNKNAKPEPAKTISQPVKINQYITTRTQTQTQTNKYTPYTPPVINKAMNDYRRKN